MKKIFRMILFSIVAVYLTSLWNKGFIISPDIKTYLEISLFVALIYYLVAPISKVVLLPLNLITFGFLSIALLMLLLHFLQYQLSLLTVKEWMTPNLAFLELKIGALKVSYFGNLLLSSLSLSAIIKTLEKLV